MDKKKLNPLARFRGFIQAGATLLTNIHLPNFAKGTLYQGNGKYVCVPGLNCYSCPGAAGACPVGAFQAVIGSSKFRFSYYITGILILFGVLLGRFICGFLCPFGWFQELLHKIPSPKLSTKKLKPLRYLKYAVLLVMVVALMLGYVTLTDVSGSVSSIKREIADLDEQHIALLTEYETTFDLATVKAAAEAAGMSKPTSGQIQYIDLSGSDSVTLYKADSSGALDGLLDSLERGWSYVLEYFR